MVTENNKFDKEKFKSVLHYIINKTSNKANVGKVVLFKILYFADFNFYEKFDKLITNETYKKIEFGPAPVDFDLAVSELINESKVELIEKKVNNFKQYKYISYNEPKFNLSSEELIEIDNAINIIGSMDGRRASAYSHEDTPWKVSEMNELLDPELVFYRTDIYSVKEN
jgi:hypothetical protein